MTCPCMNRNLQAVDAPLLTDPREPCVFCGEKHFATARRLYNERGYETENRFDIIGELVLAQWHLWEAHRDTASKLRDIRHAVQRHETVAVDKWAEACAEIDGITAAEFEPTEATP